MKLLFILDGVDFPLAVNPQLARRLAGELVATGHTVEILQLWDGATPQPQAPAGVPVHLLGFPDEYQMNLDLEGGRIGGTPVPLRLLRLAGHPAAAAAAFRQLILHKNRRQTACRRALERLDATRHYDAVVAVCAPYHAAFALAEANIRARKATWQMDPYSANQEYTPHGGAALENKMYAAMHRIFITRLMVPDYESGPLAPAQPKTQILEFPCLVPPAETNAAAHDGIQCVFAGNLHPGIRQPWFALELFSALNAPDVTLTLAGGGWEAFPEEQIAVYRKKLGARLVIPGVLAPAEARRLMAEADILVNLGNDVANQLPSKIFDYFGCGKPVLNLCVRSDDPALPYFERWPLALTLHCDKDVAQSAEALRAWLPRVKEQRLPFAQAEALFHENTPAAVARALVAGLGC